MQGHIGPYANSIIFISWNSIFFSVFLLDFQMSFRLRVVFAHFSGNCADIKCKTAYNLNIPGSRFDVVALFGSQIRNHSGIPCSTTHSILDWPILRSVISKFIGALHMDGKVELQYFCQKTKTPTLFSIPFFFFFKYNQLMNGTVPILSHMLKVIFSKCWSLSPQFPPYLLIPWNPPPLNTRSDETH